MIVCAAFKVMDNKPSRLPGMKRPPEGRDPRISPRIMVLWAILLLILPVVMWVRSQQQQTVDEITYGQLEEKLDHGLVKTAVMQSGSGALDTIKGEYEVPQAN